MTLKTRLVISNWASWTLTSSSWVFKNDNWQNLSLIGTAASYRTLHRTSKAAFIFVRSEAALPGNKRTKYWPDCEPNYDSFRNQTLDLTRPKCFFHSTHPRMTQWLPLKKRETWSFGSSVASSFEVLISMAKQITTSISEWRTRGTADFL